jgi:hypothetical protein
MHLRQAGAEGVGSGKVLLPSKNAPMMISDETSGPHLGN